MPCYDRHGNPYNFRVQVHIRVVAIAGEPIFSGSAKLSIGAMISAMQDIFATIGILIEASPPQNLFVTSLKLVTNVAIGSCNEGEITEEQHTLFQYRGQAGSKEIVIYFVRGLQSSLGNPALGCAAHPPGSPSAIVSQIASKWTLAHEVGHVLGVIGHSTGHAENDVDYLMSRGTGRITAPIPRFSDSEIELIGVSNLNAKC